MDGPAARAPARSVGCSARLIVYVVGYGPLLCGVTFNSYVKELRGAAMTWDKTEKTGKVGMPA